MTWLTSTAGKLKTAAKGARQARSRFAGALDLFHLCEIQIARSRVSEIHSLREASLRETHEQIRFDYPRLELASYFVELIDLATEPEHECPELYDLLRRALAHLAAQPASRRALLHFESELARLLGVQDPGLSSIASLARACHRLPTARAPLLDKLT